MIHALLCVFFRQMVGRQKNTLVLAMAYLLKVLIATIVMTHAVWAANGTACLPSAYSSGAWNLNSINTATAYTGSPDKILTQSTVQASISTNPGECTNSTNAYLNFLVIPCFASCVYTPSTTTFNNNGTSVDIFFVDVENSTTRSYFYNGTGVSANPLFKIEKKITVACTGGGLVASRDPVAGINVTGINGPACNGNYSVTHQVTI